MTNSITPITFAEFLSTHNVNFHIFQSVGDLELVSLWQTCTDIRNICQSSFDEPNFWKCRLWYTYSKYLFETGDQLSEHDLSPVAPPSNSIGRVVPSVVGGRNPLSWMKLYTSIRALDKRRYQLEAHHIIQLSKSSKFDYVYVAAPADGGRLMPTRTQTRIPKLFLKPRFNPEKILHIIRKTINITPIYSLPPLERFIHTKILEFAIIYHLRRIPTYCNLPPTYADGEFYGYYDQSLIPQQHTCSDCRHVLSPEKIKPHNKANRFLDILLDFIHKFSGYSSITDPHKKYLINKQTVKILGALVGKLSRLCEKCQKDHQNIVNLRLSDIDNEMEKQRAIQSPQHPPGSWDLPICDDPGIWASTRMSSSALRTREPALLASSRGTPEGRAASPKDERLRECGESEAPMAAPLPRGFSGQTSYGGYAGLGNVFD